MDKFFSLMVPPGSVIHSQSTRQVINGIPENALFLWETGSSTLSLKKEGSELLQQYSKAQLIGIKKNRLPLNFTAELKLIDQAIRNYDKQKKSNSDN